MGILVVAELGANHNGSLETALRMIEAAKDAGADAVKFQKRNLEIAIPQEQRYVLKETPWGTMPYKDYRERLEFGIQQFQVIDKTCKRLDIPWFVSVWDTDSLAQMVANFPDMPYIKIPSACLTDNQLIYAATETHKPVILSTGMSTQTEVRAAALWLSSGDILCHCISTYPCPVEDLNLRCITWLQEEFEWATIGYSGHEVGLATTLAAVALGAQYIERHFTLDRSMWGTDQAASVEPNGFRRLVKDIRNIEKALGDGKKRVTPAEIEMMAKLRRYKT